MNAYKLLSVLLLAGAAMLVGNAAAQQYPTKSIRMIVPFPPGGPSDVIARLIAIKLSESFDQQVIVDNRAGASGNIGIGIAANAMPDGYTLLAVSSSYVVNPSLYGKIPYDPYKSFAPISKLATSPNVFVAHPSVPAKSMSELISFLRSNPKKYNFATPGIGTTPDLAVVLLGLMAKVDVNTIPYAGGGPATIAVIGNQVSLGCFAIPNTTPHIRAGRMRGLAVTSTQRYPALPEVPTMAESGLTGQESDTLQGVFAPAGTPEAIVQRLYNEIARILALPDVKERIVGLGFEIVASKPEVFATQIREEVAKWQKVAKSAGITAQ